MGELAIDIREGLRVREPDMEEAFVPPPEPPISDSASEGGPEVKLPPRGLVTRTGSLTVLSLLNSPESSTFYKRSGRAKAKISVRPP